MWHRNRFKLAEFKATSMHSDNEIPKFLIKLMYNSRVAELSLIKKLGASRILFKFI